MTAQEFTPQFERLEIAFRRPAESKRAEVFREWFEALKHYHIDAVEAGITSMVQQATETFWPALGSLKEIIRGRLAGQPQAQGRCRTCHGDTWVPALPFKANGGIVYESVKRCPDCGIPAPEYRPLAQQTDLTASEYRQWLAAQSEPREPVKLPPHLQAMRDRIFARHRDGAVS